jgi:hypothetical protein
MLQLKDGSRYVPRATNIREELLTRFTIRAPDNLPQNLFHLATLPLTTMTTRARSSLS